MVRRRSSPDRHLGFHYLGLAATAGADFTNRFSTGSMDTDTGEYAMADGGEADPGTGPALSHRVRSSSDGTGACNLLDADKAREALQSNNSSFMLQDGRVRVSSTRRVNPLFGSQTGNCDSGADGPTSISEIEEECAELSWGRDEADEADDAFDVTVTYPHRKFSMRPSGALHGAGVMPRRYSGDDDPHPPSEGARPLLFGDFRGLGFATRTPEFATLDVSVLY